MAPSWKERLTEKDHPHLELLMQNEGRKKEGVDGFKDAGILYDKKVFDVSKNADEMQIEFRGEIERCKYLYPWQCR